MKKINNPNPQKFDKDRSVHYTWEKIPMYYTDVIHPKNKNKTLVVMEFLGDNVSVCWRNLKLHKVGITKLCKRIDGGFIFKDKEYKFKDLKRVI